MEIGYKPTGEGWNTASIKWGVSLPAQHQSQVPIQSAISSPNGEEKQNKLEESEAQNI